jgi:hypothetical protein
MKEEKAQSEASRRESKTWSREERRGVEIIHAYGNFKINPTFTSTKRKTGKWQLHTTADHTN